VNHAFVTLHIDNLRGENAHHQAETVFKAFARALRFALEIDPRSEGVIPSTKGSLCRVFMSTVAVIDYGMGNLRSVAQAVMAAAAWHGHQAWSSLPTPKWWTAERVVLPGQGAMRDCMRELARLGLMPSRAHAAAHKPLFGVCVGMQMLLDHSAEGPEGTPAWASSLARW
jgi:hypothetical protein